MSKNVTLRIDASTADALNKLKALNIPLNQLINNAQRANNSFTKGKTNADGMGNSVANAGKQAMQALSGMAAGMTSVYGVAQLIRQEFETIKQLEGDFAAKRTPLSQQFAAAQRVAVSGITPSILANESIRRGSDPTRFSTAFGAAASTSGSSLKRDDLFEIAELVANEFPDLTAIEEQQAMAGSIASFSSATSADPRAIAGLLQGYTRSVPAFDTGQATKSLQPLAQLLAMGDPAERAKLGVSDYEALAVTMQQLATVQNRSRDQRGEQSTTAFLQGIGQFRESAMEAGLLDKSAGLLDILRLRDKQSPEVDALKAKLLGGSADTSTIDTAIAKAQAAGKTFSPEEIAKLRARQQSDTPGSVMGSLSTERKSELAIREFLSGNSPEFQKVLVETSIPNLPVDQAAARQQFDAQQNLLRRDKITAPAFFNADIEAMTNGIDLLASGAEEAQFLTESIKSLSQKAARLSGNSTVAAGLSRELDTYSRLLTEPTSFSADQQRTNQDRIVVELRTIASQLKTDTAGKSLEDQRRLEQLSQVFTRFADKIGELFANSANQAEVLQGALQADQAKQEAFQQSMASSLPLGVSDAQRAEAKQLSDRVNRRAPQYNLPSASAKIAEQFTDTPDDRFTARLAQQYYDDTLRADPKLAAEYARQTMAAVDEAFTDTQVIRPDSLGERLAAIGDDSGLRAAYVKRRNERFEHFTKSQILRDEESANVGNAKGGLIDWATGMPYYNQKKGKFQSTIPGTEIYNVGSLLDLSTEAAPGHEQRRSEHLKKLRSAADAALTPTAESRIPDLLLRPELRDAKSRGSTVEDRIDRTNSLLSELLQTMKSTTVRNPLDRPTAVPYAAPKPLNTTKAPAKENF